MCIFETICRGQLKIHMVTNNRNVFLKFQNRTLVHNPTKLCLHMGTDLKLKMETCTGATWQQWILPEKHGWTISTTVFKCECVCVCVLGVNMRARETKKDCAREFWIYIIHVHKLSHDQKLINGHHWCALKCCCFKCYFFKCLELAFYRRFLNPISQTTYTLSGLCSPNHVESIR